MSGMDKASATIVPGDETVAGDEAAVFDLVDVALSWTAGGLGPCVGDDGDDSEQQAPG